MATQRLTRDLENAMLGGVCAGIANRLDLDPTIVRVATVVLALITGGVVLIIYVALWLIMPRPDAPGRPSRDRINEELRDATDRVQEAAGILTRAARQAADELSEASRRRAPSAQAPDASAPPMPAQDVTPPPPPAPTSEYDAGATPPEPPAAPETGSTAGDTRPPQ